MQITKAVRQKGTNSFTGFSNGKTLAVTAYKTIHSIEINTISEILFDELCLNSEAYEPVSIERFNKVVNWVKRRINQQL